MLSRYSAPVNGRVRPVEYELMGTPPFPAVDPDSAEAYKRADVRSGRQSLPRDRDARPRRAAGAPAAGAQSGPRLGLAARRDLHGGAARRPRDGGATPVPHLPPDASDRRAPQNRG